MEMNDVALVNGFRDVVCTRAIVLITVFAMDLDVTTGPII